MNKYNIKVGDYVETIDGGIGYVINVNCDSFEWMIVKSRETLSAMEAGEETIAGFSTVKKFYKRIGENDFTKKENKFEPINRFNSSKDYTEIKINELIDHINAIQERLNEYDSTRTD